MNIIDHDNLDDFRDAETYDLHCDAFNEDFLFLDQWVKSLGSPLLDLACGTGRMSIRLAAQGYQITGVDLVPEMIARARQKADDRAVSVEWVVSDARSFHLQKQFAGIFMLMNAFQFLLTRADHEGMLACVREHLQPDGQFLFETRNPSPRNLFEVQHPEGETYAPPDGGQLVITEYQHYDPMTQIQHYNSLYQWMHLGIEQKATRKRVALRYVFPQEMESLLYYNGFEIISVYGNWQQEPLTAASPAMIYVCRKRRS